MEIDYTYLDETEVPEPMVLYGSCKCDCGWGKYEVYEKGKDWSLKHADSALRLSHEQHVRPDGKKCHCTPVICPNWL